MDNGCSFPPIAYISDKYEAIKQKLDGTTLGHYLLGRAVIHGLPLSIITSIAAAYLFACATPAAAATFGVVNYVSLTALSEVVYNMRGKLDNFKSAALISMIGAVSLGFMRNICQTPMGFQAALILSIAAFAGQVFRTLCQNEEFEVYL